MESLLLVILVGLALAAIRSRDLLVATSILGAYSLIMALLWEPTAVLLRGCPSWRYRWQLHRPGVERGCAAA